MIKKIICLSVMLLITHGTVVSMMHTKKMINRTSRLQLNKRALCTGLKDDIRDAAFLRSANVSDNWMDENAKRAIRRAYIDSIYKVAQIEAMCKISADPNLDHYQKKYLHDQVPHIVKE